MDIKASIEGIDKASVTLGVNERFAKNDTNINLQQNQAVSNNVVTIDEFYDEM
jgi:hypothetical protein